MLNEDQSFGIRHNGIDIYVSKWSSHKKPVLAVKTENENCIYKVASFNSVETADWFIDMMQKFFSGLTADAEKGCDASV